MKKNFIRLFVFGVGMVACNQAQGAAIHNAAKTGDLDKLNQELAKKVDVNLKSVFGGTAIVLASKKGHANIVERLLKEKEIDVNIKSGLPRRTALELASMANHASIVGMLAKVKDIDVGRALQYASNRGHLSIVKMLLKVKDIDVNLQVGIFRRTAIIYAVAKGHANVVKELLKVKDIDVNLKGGIPRRTALGWAKAKDHTKIIEMLKAAGATE